jgi:hypothetical protein
LNIPGYQAYSGNLLFKLASVSLLNKIDLLAHVDFGQNKAAGFARAPAGILEPYLFNVKPF